MGRFSVRLFVHPSVRPFVRPSVRLSIRQAWLAGPQAWLAGPQAWLDGPQAWLDGPEGGRMDKQMNERTNEHMENLPILQDFERKKVRKM